MCRFWLLATTLNVYHCCLPKRKSSRFQHADKEIEAQASAWEDGKRKPPSANRLTDYSHYSVGNFSSCIPTLAQRLHYKARYDLLLGVYSKCLLEFSFTEATLQTHIVRILFPQACTALFPQSGVFFFIATLRPNSVGAGNYSAII